MIDRDFDIPFAADLALREMLATRGKVFPLTALAQFADGSSLKAFRTPPEKTA